MLTKRIIGLLLWSNGRCVKSTQFQNPIVVGNPVRVAETLSDQQVDEIIILDIDSDNGTRQNFCEDLRKISFVTSVPITAGGGIISLGTAAQLFDNGADRITVNSLLRDNPSVVTELVNVYGGQSVVGVIDYWDGTETRTDRDNLLPRSLDTLDTAARVREAGVGEIILQSVCRDGQREGLDLASLNDALQGFDVPVVLAGGAGSYADLAEAFLAGADGVACGSLFLLADGSPTRAKSTLRNLGVPVRRNIRGV